MTRWPNKYGSKKTEVDGVTLDSKKEAKRYQELRILEKTGEIKDLKRQVKFLILPEQREVSAEIYKSGPRKGQLKPGKLLERSIEYVADFVYTQDGQTIVEDTKGFRTKDYIIKRKLMLWVHGIRIREI